YNLRFKGNCLIGRGADNLYRAFYTAGKNNNLSIGKIVCTRKAPMFEMRSFGEYKYFCHLERAYRWDFRDWTLELHTCDESGNEVILEFVPIYK
ncbi:MAG: hypothetical protein LBI03_00985, partial [Clostridiales bacterium]|nr:hypothetical protein [Clostridiales bacterium]